MSGNSLTTSASLQCPHGGAVQIISTNTRVKGDGAPLALATDSFVITGCPYQIPMAPSPIPSPCVKVLWVVTDLQAKVNGAATLSRGSTGICVSAAQLPQGQVVIVNTQMKVKSQ